MAHGSPELVILDDIGLSVSGTLGVAVVVARACVTDAFLQKMASRHYNKTPEIYQGTMSMYNGSSSHPTKQRDLTMTIRRINDATAGPCRGLRGTTSASSTCRGGGTERALEILRRETSIANLVGRFPLRQVGGCRRVPADVSTDP